MRKSKSGLVILFLIQTLFEYFVSYIYKTTSKEYLALTLHLDKLIVF
jgi:hypothetical protein